MTNLIDDETASRYWAERESAPEAERESRNTALMDWAKAKKADQFRAEQEQAERAYTDLDGWWKENGAGHVFEKDEDRLEVANRRYIANQFQQTPDQQGRYYPTYRDEYLQKTFGKSGLSETETFNLIRDSLTARKATEDALRELPGSLAKGMFSNVAEGKTLDETDSWFLFQDWKDRHADKLATLPDGWEAAMLDRAVKLQARTETMMRDLAPESKRAFDTLLAFTRPEDAAGLPPADRADVENLSKEFAKLDPQQRQDIYSTLYYAAEAEGAGMGKGFFEKVGEGIARGGVNIYDDMAMVAEDRNARENLRRLRSGEMVYSAPNNMVRRADEFIQLGAAEQGAPLNEGVPADATPLTEEQKTELIAQNEQRLSELKALREIRQIADGTIDPIKTEMDGVMGEIVQGAYTISQSLPYMAIAAVPYVGLPAVMGALTNSNYLRMLDAYQDMDPDAALTISAAIAGPQAFIERFQANALIGRSPALNALMRKMTDVRIPIAARLAIGYGANVAYQTGQEFVQEAMPVLADQIAAAIREDMPEFDAGKAWGAYVDQMPDIFYSMLWAGLIGTGASSFRELKRNGQYERSLGELEMVGITGEAAQDIAAEQDPDAATSKFREAWDKRTPEDIQAGIAKRAAQLGAARSTQQNPELPVRRIEQNQDGTLTHIIERPDGTVLYRTNDSDAADIALIEQTRRVVANDLQSDISIVTEVRDQWLSEDPTNVAIESDTTTAQQKLEQLQAAGNVAQIEELHRRIATSLYKDTPYDQINILGEATVEDLGEMVFRGVITLNQNSRPEDAREEIHHVAVRKALMKGSVTLETLRGWLDATETALPDKFPGLVRDNENDIVESLARVQRAYEDGKINAEEETNLPASFVDYIKRMLKVFKEVLQRAVALRGAFKQGILPGDYEAFLAESVGLNQQTMVDTTRERVVGDILTNGGQMLMDFSIGSRASAVSNDTPSIRASNATITGPANYSIGAFHGTPHKVDRFSIKKVGTGEGAQVYGWGLYFAKNRKVAEEYRNRLTSDTLILDGISAMQKRTETGNQIWGHASQYFADGAKTKEQLLAKIKSAREFEKSRGNKYFSDENYAEVENAISKTNEIAKGNMGNLYTVELDVDDADLLDWDKTLSEQSEKVRGILEKWADDKELWESMKTWKADSFYGANLKDDAAKQKSEFLLRLGIPGIRYLDQGSRSEGQGTHNYVVFDENLIKITEENGNRIPASEALAQTVSTDTNYSIGKKQDADYLAAVERGDMETVQKMVDDAANSAGYLPHGDFRDSHTAPSAAGSDEEVKNGDADASLVQVARGVHIQPDDYFDPRVGPRYYSYQDKAGMEAFKAIRAAMDEIQQGKKALVTVFRAVPNDIKGTKLENRDWVTPSKTYAVDHGEARFGEGEYRIIKESVPAENLFWDGNDIREWGKDDGKDYAYKNTKNNRKLIDPVTYDENGNVIPLSQRFNPRSADINYSIGIAPNGKPSNLKPEEQALAQSPEFMQWGGNWEVLAEDAAWKKTVEDYYSNPNQREPLRIGRVPSVLRAVGVSDAPMVMPPSVIQKVTVKKHTLTREMVEQIPSALRDPIFVFNSATEPNSVTILTDIRHQGKNVVAAIHLDRPAPRKPANLIVSLHDRPASQIENWIKDGLILYANQGKARAYFRSARLQLPREGSKAGNKKLRTEADVVNRSVNPESVTVKTDENGEPLASEIARFRQETETSSYSIASQREIDRVNAALGGMNRGPDERLKVYERAKQKFSKLMAWNSDELGAMADTGSDETQIRRTQLLQGLGELDAILSTLPPEVRGRVGGYTKLANIAPMDVFKDGVKVSEAKNMTGAIISAWMKEGQNIGQAGKQVSLPPGYTAKENLASKRADKALADFFRDRIKKIDIELEKVLAREYRTAILDLVKKSRPKAGDNNVRKSTLGPETQKLADMVQRATLMDEDAVAERMLQLEQSMQSSDDNSALVEEWGILNTFGDLDNRNSETLAQAYQWFRDQLKAGRESWRIKEEARIAENRERSRKTVEWLGGATAQDRFRNRTLKERMADWANNLLLDHASFEQFVNALLPPEIAADFANRLRKADVAAQKTEIDQREGILNALRDAAKAAGTTTGKALLSLKAEVPSAVRYLDGRKVKNTKLTIEQAEKIVRGEIDRGDLTDTDVRNLADELADLPADTRKENITLKQVVYPGKEVRLPMTRGKAIQLLLSWNQPDVRDKMMREGWTEDSLVDLRELTSDPVSQGMLTHAQELYGKGYAVTNPVYARMFGMNMPQAKNYAPTRFNHSNDVKDVGLDGSPVATGTTPGFAKSRVSHSAEIASEDALSVMQQHILAQSHWVNFAELAREFRSLITNPEVRKSIKQKHGQAVLKTAELWATQMEQRGGNQAREAAWVNNILGAVIGGQSVASLGFNLKTLAMQLDNAVRFALALDTKQIISAMQSPDQLIQDIKTVFESDALQTRLRGGATAEARFLFEKYGGRPGKAAKVSEVAMSAINWMDSATTSFSAAIVYRANLNQALESGMPENLARETALDAAAAAIYRFAQPVSFGQKSNMENSGNIYQKAFFLFMSDPRLKASIMADSIRGLATGHGDKWTHIRRLVSIELMAVLSHVVASAYRDAFTDDDDEEIWSPGGWARALLLAPVQGYLFLGTMLDSVFSQLTGAGFFTPTQNPLLTISQTGIRALKNADDILAFDDPDALLKEWVSIARMLAVNPTMAAPAVLLNMVKPVYGLYENATSEE